MDSEREYPTAERAVYGTWRPLGCGDRLYVEAHGPIPAEVVDRLEALAGTMRDLVRAHPVVLMDIGTYGAPRLRQPPAGAERRQVEATSERRPSEVGRRGAGS